MRGSLSSTAKSSMRPLIVAGPIERKCSRSNGPPGDAESAAAALDRIGCACAATMRAATNTLAATATAKRRADIGSLRRVIDPARDGRDAALHRALPAAKTTMRGARAQPERRTAGALSRRAALSRTFRTVRPQRLSECLSMTLRPLLLAV